MTVCQSTSFTRVVSANQNSIHTPGDSRLSVVSAAGGAQFCRIKANQDEEEEEEDFKIKAVFVSYQLDAGKPGQVAIATRLVRDFCIQTTSAGLKAFAASAKYCTRNWAWQDTRLVPYRANFRIDLIGSCKK